jgi:hypothetical protein
MSRVLLTITALLSAVVFGCSPASLRWQNDAAAVLGGVRIEEANSGYRQEYESAHHAFERGEELLQAEEVAAADEYFRISLLKGDLLREKLADRRDYRAEEARIKVRSEQLALAQRQAEQDEHRRLKQSLTGTVNPRSRSEKNRQQKDRPLPTQYTVKRGETLPQIAAHPDVYNDYRLWLLLYRSNRDQIRDPNHLWSGQILSIPRNPSREELAEARRQAGEKPL